MKEQRKNILPLINMSISEALALVAFISGISYSVVTMEVGLETANASVIQLRSDYKEDVKQLKRERDKRDREIHDQLKEQRQDMKEIQRDIKQILRALK